MSLERPAWFRPGMSNRDALALRDGAFCWLCKKPLLLGKKQHKHPDYATLDHVIPRSQGGPGHIDNYRLACARCNRLRGTQPADAFVRPHVHAPYTAVLPLVQRLLTEEVRVRDLRPGDLALRADSLQEVITVYPAPVERERAHFVVHFPPGSTVLPGEEPMPILARCTLRDLVGGLGNVR